MKKIFGPDGLIANAHPDYEYRPGQVQMAQAVMRAFEGRHHLIVEAGTGTGKTLAYLVPAVAAALGGNGRVIVSTGTKNLQEQLMEKDIPFLQSVMPKKFSAAYMKGRNNYLCLARFHRSGNTPVLSGLEEMDYFEEVTHWAKGTETGDRAELSNLPENLAFFSGAIDAAGSFGGIYQSAVFAYGNGIIKDPVDGDRILELQPLKALDQSGAFKDQTVAIAPIRATGGAPVESDPLLSKDIRFLFAPNSSNLDTNNPDNLKSLEAIKQLLQVSPGSTVLLRGHVDNSMVEEFRKRGGDAFVRQMALKAVDFSKQRANEIKRLLIEQHGVEAKRLDSIGRGWEEPLGPDHEQNRRVEAQWFTLE